MYKSYMDMRRHTLILTFGINNEKLQQGTIREEKRKTRAFFKAIVLTFHIMKPNMYLLAIYLWGDVLSFFFTIKRE
jgi:hypothetical protein